MLDFHDFNVVCINMKRDNLRRHYSFLEICQLVIFLLRSKMISPRIRLIRFPFVIRGARFVDFGNRLTTGHGCRFEVFPIDSDKRKRLIFGNNIQVNDYVHISAIDRVEIGDGCLFASHIYISDNSHGQYGDNSLLASSPDMPPASRQYITAPVKIGKNVWLGEGVIVLPGVTIGDGCVIGAHSVVNKDIPSASIAVGSPAKVIKKYSYEKKCWIKV